MPSTFSPNLRLELIGTGEAAGLWGVLTNNNLGDLLEQAISGSTSLDVTSGDITLTALNGVVDEARSAVLQVTGTPGVTRVLTIPNVSKTYTIFNASNATVGVKTTSGAAYNIPAAATAYIYCDGSNVITGRTITDGAEAILANSAPYNSPAFTGVPTAPTAAQGTNTTQIATTAFVQAALPAGVIVMWSGSIASIPSGWALCDGGGGRPDLRNRFIVGAGSGYAVGATGGADTVTLTTANIPSHTHSISGSGTTGSENQNHTHNGTTGGESADHAHFFSAGTSGVGDHTHSLYSDDNIGAGGGSNPDFVIGSGRYAGETRGAGAHSHSVSGWTGGRNTGHVHGFSTGGISNNHQHAFSFSGTSGAAGSGTAHENRPPFFALAYIIKT